MEPSDTIENKKVQNSDTTRTLAYLARDLPREIERLRRRITKRKKKYATTESK